MKKTIALMLALMLLLLAGCGQAAPAPTPTPAPTPEPTPEPPHIIPMSGLLTDVLDISQQDFMAGLKKSPPAMAAIKLGDAPAAVVLDIDDVRELCTILTEAELSAKTDEAGDSESTVTLVKENGESCAMSFSGEKLAVDGAYYELADAGELWDFAREAVRECDREAESNKALLGTEEFYNCSYDNDDDRLLARVVSQPAELVSSDGQESQTLKVKLGVTNTAQHLLMSAKLIASYVDAEGRVIASVPVDLDFNNAPVYIYETRDYELEQTVYNVTGADLSGGALLAEGVMIEVVSVNAPNEAGH